MKKYILTLVIGCMMACGISYATTPVMIIDRLVGEGIITYQPNILDYRLQDNVLRQELVGIIVNGLYDRPTKGCVGYFSDLSSTSPNTWACSVVEFAADMGIVSKSNSQFRPQAHLTNAESLALILGSVCHNERVDQSVWDNYSGSFGGSYENWQKKTLINAHKNGLIESTVTYDPNAYTTRGEAFTHLSKALYLDPCDDDSDEIVPPELNAAPPEPIVKEESMTHEYTISLTQRSPDFPELDMTVVREDGTPATDFTGYVITWLFVTCENCSEGAMWKPNITIFEAANRGKSIFLAYEEHIQEGVQYQVVESDVGVFIDRDFIGFSIDNVSGEIDLTSAPDEESETTIPLRNELTMTLDNDTPSVGDEVMLTITTPNTTSTLDDGVFFLIIDGDYDAVIGNESTDVGSGFSIEGGSIDIPIVFTTTGASTIYLYELTTDQEWELSVTVATDEVEVVKEENQSQETQIAYSETSCVNASFAGKACDICYTSNHPAIIWEHQGADDQELVYLDEQMYFSESSDIETQETDWKYSNDVIWTSYENVQEFYIGGGEELLLGYYDGTNTFPNGSVLQYTLNYRSFLIDSFEESDPKTRNICTLVSKI